MLGDSSRPCHCWLLHAQRMPLNRDDSQIENWQGCMDPAYNTFCTEGACLGSDTRDPTRVTRAAAYATAVTTYNMGSGSSYADHVRVLGQEIGPGQNILVALGWDYLDTVAGTCITMPATTDTPVTPTTDTPVTPAGRHTGEGGGKGMMGEGGGKGMGGGEGTR